MSINEEQSQRKPFMKWQEIIVVFVIIGMLASLLVPARQSSSGPRSRCALNKMQIYAALLSYHHKHQTFPPAYTVDEEGKPLHSWRVLMLPYLSDDSFLQQIRLDEPWDSEYNQQFHDKMPDIFACPLVSRKNDETPYQVLTGVGTYFPGAECRSLDDPTLNKKNIVLLLESRNPVCWMAPVDLPVEAIEDNTTHIVSHHARHPNVIMADGNAVDFSRLEVNTNINSRNEK